MTEKILCDAYDACCEYGRCKGTKELDRCNCGGNKLCCDFYKHIRDEAEEELLKSSDIPYERLMEIIRLYINSDIDLYCADYVLDILVNICKCSNEEIKKLGFDRLINNEPSDTETQDVLRAKINKEIRDYRKRLVNSLSEEVYDHWYKTAFFETYHNVITENVDKLYDGVTDWLLTKDDPLQYLYDKWFNSDLSMNLDSDFIIDYINSLYSYYQEHEDEDDI